MSGFRIIIYRKVVEFLNLVANIIAKHTADGAESLLDKIDMTDVSTKYAFAQAKHLEGEQYSFNRELATQERNLALGIEPDQKSYTPGTVRYYVSSIRDFLMGLFRGNEQKLGDWGFEVNTSGKKTVSVIIPRNARRLLIMAKRVIAKHNADGVDTLLDEFDMVDFANKVEYAEEQNALSEELFFRRKDAFQARDLALGYARKQRSTNPGTLLYYVSSIRDVLLGYKRGSEMELGLWGFHVVNTPSPSDPSPVGPVIVSGVITNAVTLSPVEGVTLEFQTSLGSIDALTNTLGEYNAVVEIPEMELITVHISHPGYLPFSDTQAITPNEEFVFNFSIQPV